MLTGSSREVAVVDDDLAVLESFRFMLELAGFAVATYGSAAAFLARAEAPRCVILDHHMPLMTGLELTVRLRRSGSQVPVLLITSAPNAFVLTEAARIGVQVLEKPPDEAALIAFVLGSSAGGGR